MRLWRAPTLALILLLGVITQSDAQFGGHGSGRQRRQQQTPQQADPLADLPAAKQPWPRLDAGAILCASHDDLVAYQTRMVAAAPVSTGGPAPDCHIVQKQTGISILDQDGPSRTQVVTTDAAKETGWTNVYLPSTPPRGATAGGTGQGR